MGRRKLESEFQRGLKKEIRARFPGSMVLKTDPNDIQGIPDLMVLYNDHWAALEVKQSSKATKRPNQERRVEKMSKMSFASFIFPENETEVLNELQRTFKA